MSRWNDEVFATLNEGEQSLVKWQYRYHGSFFTKLWECIITADGINMERLRRGFPSHIEAYYRFRQEPGYWENIQIRLGLLNPKTREEE